MDRRQFATATAATAVALGAATRLGAAEKMQHHKLDAAIESCLDACAECACACDSCAMTCAHHLAQGNQAHLDTMRLCLDCGQMCSAAATIIGRGGPLTDTMRKACMEACQQCADACATGDAAMVACAKACQACQACADACRIA